jgi:hypothetical protein
VAAAKPLPSDFQPVLSDFGLVRFVTSAQQTSSGQIAGTPAYGGHAGRTHMTFTP